MIDRLKNFYINNKNKIGLFAFTALMVAVNSDLGARCFWPILHNEPKMPQCMIDDMLKEAEEI